MVGIDRIEALAGRLPTMTWAVCVAAPGTAHPLKGYVTDHLTEKHINAGDCDIYLCGPPPMVEAVRILMRDQGVDPRHLYYEGFSQRAVHNF